MSRDGHQHSFSATSLISLGFVSRGNPASPRHAPGCLSNALDDFPQYIPASIHHAAMADTDVQDPLRPGTARVRPDHAPVWYRPETSRTTRNPVGQEAWTAIWKARRWATCVRLVPRPVVRSNRLGLIPKPFLAYLVSSILAVAPAAVPANLRS